MSILPLVLATAFQARQPRSVITGDYIEDRSNRVYGCYCEWSGERVTGGREAILGWRIQSGEFQGIPLAGVKIAAVIIGEATLSAGNAPRKSILFVESSATKAQQQTALSLIRGSYSDLLGRILSENSVPIQFHTDAERATLRAGDLLNLELRKANPPKDALQGAILWYDPFIPMTESTLGTTLNTKYHGSEFDQQWELNEQGISGYYGRFALSPR